MIHYIPDPASNAYTHLYDEHCVVVAERGEEFRVHPLYAFEVQIACRAAYSLGLERGARWVEDREVPAPSYVLAKEIRALKPLHQEDAGMRGGAPGNGGRAALAGEAGGVGDASDAGQQARGQHAGTRSDEWPVAGPTGPVNGFWRDAEWLPCRDGKLRPVEPGVAPLVAGTPNRVGRLRGYGNALCAPVAEGFIRAYIESK